MKEQRYLFIEHNYTLSIGKEHHINQSFHPSCIDCISTFILRASWTRRWSSYLAYSQWIEALNKWVEHQQHMQTQWGAPYSSCLHNSIKGAPYHQWRPDTYEGAPHYRIELRPSIYLRCNVISSFLSSISILRAPHWKANELTGTEHRCHWLEHHLLIRSNIIR